jgi:chemotaxis signal transduction protein
VSRKGTGFLLVRAGNRRVGLPLSQVIEVTQLGPVHPVPSVEAAVRGVVAVHGRMVPVVHLGALLEGCPCPGKTEHLAVVVVLEERRLCLEVEDAEILVRQPVLPVPPGEMLPWAIGVARYGDGLVPLLDLSALGSRLMEAAST